MQGFVTISEFARLRNVNINSLRYYEKIGALIPAYVDPRTGYRYYSAEQLVVLDTIHLCISLGIPLKQLKEYSAESGSIEIRRLLEDGKRAAKERIAETQANLWRIEATLEQIDNLKAYQNKTGIYERKFPARRLVVSSPFYDIEDLDQAGNSAEGLHAYAQENNMFPALPAGMLIRFGKAGEPPEHRMFFGINGKKAGSSQSMTLPAGRYLCGQTRLHEAKDIKDFIINVFGYQENAVIVVSNIVLEKLSFCERMAEIQLLKEGNGTVD